MADDDLERRVDELESTLADLRRELGRPSPRRRPPTPGELLGLAGEYAIPALIAGLEAQIRALELLEATLAAGRTVDENRTAVEDRVGDVGSRVLARLDETLADLERALTAGDLPREEEARAILADARSLSREVRSELAAEEASRDRVQVDVDDELRTIKRDLDDAQDGT